MLTPALLTTIIILFPFIAPRSQLASRPWARKQAAFDAASRRLAFEVRRRLRRRRRTQRAETPSDPISVLPPSPGTTIRATEGSGT